jgi:hypothetical protein
VSRILYLNYTQTGDSAKVGERFLEPIRAAGHEIVSQHIEPVEPYPFPWGSFSNMLQVFPECHFGGGKGIKPLTVANNEPFDLVILVYQIWFLAPSIPIQDFFRSQHAELLRGKKVITICVCRDMWHAGSQKMKELLVKGGAYQIDNIAVTYQGRPTATYITVPRMLTTGKRDRVWGLPPAEIEASQYERVGMLGEAVAQKLPTHGPESREPMLTGLGAVKVYRDRVIPEVLGSRMYYDWSRLVKYGPFNRKVMIFIFMIYLPLSITCCLPFVGLGCLLILPLLIGPVERYSQKLAQPSGEKAKPTKA